MSTHRQDLMLAYLETRAKHEPHQSVAFALEEARTLAELATPPQPESRMEKLLKELVAKPHKDTITHTSAPITIKVPAPPAMFTDGTELAADMHRQQREAAHEAGEQNIQAAAATAEDIATAAPTGAGDSNGEGEEPSDTPPLREGVPLMHGQEPTTKQRAALQALHMLHKRGGNVTAQMVAAELVLVVSSATHLLKMLEAKGYLSTRKLGRNLYYDPIRHTDGTPLVRTETYTDASGHKVTRYPPMYAHGARPAGMSEIKGA